MQTFVLATANAHKVEEIRAVLEAYDVELLPRPDVPDVDETETTLEGNALLKARALVEATGLAAIADDTGLFIDALDGRPGVFSARYAGDSATYEENVQKVLAEMRDVTDKHRLARFRTVIVVAYPGGDSSVVVGDLDGVILKEPRGDGGFGYDPIFTPLGSDGRSLAQLSPSEKNAISHRGVALRALGVMLLRS